MILAAKNKTVGLIVALAVALVLASVMMVLTTKTANAAHEVNYAQLGAIEALYNDIPTTGEYYGPDFVNNSNYCDLYYCNYYTGYYDEYGDICYSEYYDAAGYYPYYYC